MKIKSILDVVTNSSSEIYVINPQGKTMEEILDDLLEVNKKNLESGEDVYSGDCQDIELYGNFKIHKKKYFPSFILDQGFYATKKYLKENYIIHKRTL